MHSKNLTDPASNLQQVATVIVTAKRKREENAMTSYDPKQGKGKRKEKENILSNYPSGQIGLQMLHNPPSCKA